MSEKKDFRRLHPIAISFWNSYQNDPEKICLTLVENNTSYESLFTLALKYLSYIKTNVSDSRILFHNRDDFDSYARLLAICLSGGSFVPVDYQWPTERIQDIKEQLNVDFILDNDHQLEGKSEVKNLEDLRVFDSSEAYVLYTSGSTGKPKGVPLTKLNLEALLDFYISESTYDFRSQDVFLQTFQLSFDFSMFPMLMSWHFGARLVLCDFESFRFIEIPHLLEEEKVTVLTMVPYVLKYLEKYMTEFSFEDLRYSIFGGGPLYLDQAEKWKKCLPNGEIRNVYGPTETTVICSDYNGLESKNGIVAMGYLFPSFDYKIVEGELWLNGAQVFPGYMDNKEILQDGFYPTGDLVSVDSKGLFFFEGRKDFQVKIDGYRVELEEIEGRVQEQFSITSQACLIDNELKLIVEDIPLGLEDFLKTSFPKYMQVKEVIQIEHFELNANNKIDRKANIDWIKKQS